MPSATQSTMNGHVPKKQLPVSFAWNDLKQQHIKDLISLTSKQSQQNYLAEILGLKDYNRNTKSQVLLELYYYLLSFAREQGFDDLKTSTFFSFMNYVHTTSMASPHFTLEESYELFKSLVVKHSIDRPPFSVAVFSLGDVKAITDYITHTYYRHYKMYQYTFSYRPLCTISTKSIHIDLPFEIPPLVEGVMLPPGAQPEKQDSRPEASQQTPAASEESIKPSSAPIHQEASSISSFAAAPQEDKSARRMQRPESEAVPATSQQQPIQSPRNNPSIVKEEPSPVEPAQPSVLEEHAKVNQPSWDKNSSDAVTKLAIEVKNIAVQSAVTAVQEQMATLKQDFEEMMKQHEDQLMQKITKLTSSRSRRNLNSNE